ncbi:MAG: D-glycero-beta-D-manno-heptose 1,7-bisphosphate 7-phosphatase [Pseudomonadota bacterium]
MKLIILDRDGVINYDSPDFIKSPEEWHAIPGSLEAIALLNKAGIKVAIASNQSGLARGYFTEDTLKKIHQKMLDELKKCGGHIDKIFYCPHGPHDDCACRKPKPGMLLQAFEYFNVKPEEACFAGDSQRDIDAASAAKCRAIYINTDNTLYNFITSFLGENL